MFTMCNTVLVHPLLLFTSQRLSVIGFMLNSFTSPKSWYMYSRQLSICRNKERERNMRYCPLELRGMEMLSGNITKPHCVPSATHQMLASSVPQQSPETVCTVFAE